jgi:membrane-associated phospholipid phosphatase
LKIFSYPLVLLLALVLMSWNSGPAYAESGTEEDVSLGHFPGAVWDDITALPTWENTWWLLGGTALTIGVYQFEDPDGAAEALNKGAWDSLSDFGNIWGDMRVQAPLALGTWGIGSWAGNDDVAGFGFDLSRGLLLTVATTSIIKAGVNRTRPNGEDYSFPSGHTAAAFTTAGVVTQRYGGWLGGLSIGLGVLTAMGRMEDMKHYASDVVAGATIGWIIGRTVARKDPNDKTAWQVVPFGNGLAMIKSF